MPPPTKQAGCLPTCTSAIFPFTKCLPKSFAMNDGSPNVCNYAPPAAAPVGGGMSPAAEAFLDQITTWRELGFNFCHSRKDYDQFESLPMWAQRTLNEHASDPRPFTYSLEEFAGAQTHDSIWNAAQTQLLVEGRIHNYLRMLWGKKILEWTRSPQEALQVMIELNNRYALDGRYPNSYSGIFWCLGRYDHPWGPVRPIFGTVRYMNSASTARKFNVKEYLRKYSPNPMHTYLENGSFEFSTNPDKNGLETDHP
jgi:deoxyribodipyrimidine photolyase